MKRASLNQAPPPPEAASDLTDRLLGGTARPRRARRKKTGLVQPAEKKTESKRPRQPRAKTRAKRMPTESDAVKDIQRRQAEAGEPLPYVPYRPVPERPGPTLHPRPQRASREAAQGLDKAMEASRKAVEALRAASESAPARQEIGVRYRLDALARHVETVAQYLASRVEAGE